MPCAWKEEGDSDANPAGVAFRTPDGQGGVIVIMSRHCKEPAPRSSEANNSHNELWMQYALAKLEPQEETEV